MQKGIQTKLNHIGDYGCYFLCLLHKAGFKEDNIVEIYDYCLKNNWIDEDCTILRPDDIALYLFRTNLHCTITEQKPRNCVFYIECWYNKRTGYRHFKLPDWDSLENSVTVKEGYIESYRAYSAS